jgi:hypothetical protein
MGDIKATVSAAKRGPWSGRKPPAGPVLSSPEV